MNWKTLLTNIAKDNDTSINWMLSKRLLNPEPKCPKCDGLMKEEKITNSEIIPFRWRCEKSRCRGTRSLLSDSWWENCRIRLDHSLIIVYCFSRKLSITECVHELNGIISSKTVGEWYSLCREMCSYELGNEEKHGKIGGPGTIVEVDEAKFGKRKNHRGSRREGVWVIGGFCRNTGDIFLQPVLDRTKATCQEVIQENIKNGTTIFTDMWASYEDLDDLENEFDHWAVNHTYCFKNDDDVHTNGIEGTWKWVKASLTGVPRDKKPEHFMEYIWRNRTKDMDPFQAFIGVLQDFYTF